VRLIYKLVCIDLDGTLLNSKKYISQENTEAITSAIDKGVNIVICSGRIFAGAKAFAKQLNIKGPLIACNGAIIKDIESEEIIYSNYMSRSDCQRVIDICHKYKIYFHAYIGDTLYTEKLEYSSLFYWNKNKELPLAEKVDIKLVDNISLIIENSSEAVLKIVAISEDSELLSECRKKVSEISSVAITSSDIKNFEVMNFAVNKGQGVKLVAEKLNISKNETIAIGDNENDIQMFQYAGMKVAMGNAEVGVKKMADYITLKNDDNGVADTLNKYIK
jgi:Cof subfamily protein (haloacid dehalogenase superfamily)